MQIISSTIPTITTQLKDFLNFLKKEPKNKNLHNFWGLHFVFANLLEPTILKVKSLDSSAHAHKRFFNLLDIHYTCKFGRIDYTIRNKANQHLDDKIREIVIS